VFLLVAGLIWLHGHIQMETCWSARHTRAKPLQSSLSGVSYVTGMGRPAEQVHLEDDLGCLQI